MHVTYSSASARRQAVASVRLFDQELKRLTDPPPERRRSWLQGLAFWKREDRSDGQRPTMDETQGRLG